MRYAATLSLLTVATAAVAQDECTSAIAAVNGVNGPFNNGAATTSPEPWACSAGGSDLWFGYTATCTGQLQASTCSPVRDFDTMVEVFDAAAGCGGLVSLACNDDRCSVGSSVTVGVASGQVLLIRVGGFSGDVGNFELLLSCAGGPANDECAGAVPLVLGSNPGLGNLGASNSLPAWSCSNAGTDLWYRYQATCTAPHTFATCGGSNPLDTVLEVFAGPCGQLQSLGCNDDTCNLGSQVTANLTLGQTCWLRVGGYAGNVGSYDLQVSIGTNSGTFQNLGAGCGATTFSVFGNPNLTGSLTAQLGNVTGAPFVGVGFVGNPMPFCTCTLGHDWAAANFGAAVTIAIPCLPPLVGMAVYLQGADLFGAGGCPAPQLTLTDTWQVVIG
ncbi:MAG: hypothetical protein IPK26_07805 [Planctomycetes bacterium]|nr:hypothetical protein [Planctomycetota bacterium]